MKHWQKVIIILINDNGFNDSTFLPNWLWLIAHYQTRKVNQGGNQGDDSAGQRDGATECIVHMQIIARETERGRRQPDGGTNEGEMRTETQEKGRKQVCGWTFYNKLDGVRAVKKKKRSQIYLLGLFAWKKKKCAFFMAYLQTSRLHYDQARLYFSQRYNSCLLLDLIVDVLACDWCSPRPKDCINHNHETPLDDVILLKKSHYHTFH